MLVLCIWVDKYKMSLEFSPPTASIKAKVPWAVVKDFAVECVSLMKSLYISPNEFMWPIPEICKPHFVTLTTTEKTQPSLYCTFEKLLYCSNYCSDILLNIIFTLLKMVSWNFLLIHKIYTRTNIIKQT